MATTTNADSKGPIVFYDISHKPPVEESACSPNPWKTRFALNFKGVPYSTSWVAMPDIAKVRKSLGQPAGRKFADGTDFYTLPVIQDAATGTTVGDTFDIAIYLQRTYPESGAGDLLPAVTLDFTYKPPFESLIPLSERQDDGFPDYYQFNYNVDQAFTTHTILMVNGLPFDPATAEQSRAEFLRRANFTSWDQFTLPDEAREQVLQSFEAVLGDLAKLFRVNPDGPFLLGQKASYGDFIVGAWLRMAHTCMPKEEWQRLRGWHDGIFGKLHDGLDAYAQMN